MKSIILSFIITKGLIVGGLFMVIIAVVILNNGVVKLKIKEDNRIVLAKVIESPEDCENLGRRGGFYKLKYNGKVFIKRGKRIICETVVGNKNIQVLTNLRGDKLHFFNEYDESNDFLSGILLGIFGIVIVYMGSKSS